MSKPELAVESNRVKSETDLLESTCRNTKNLCLRFFCRTGRENSELDKIQKPTIDRETKKKSLMK